MSVLAERKEIGIYLRDIINRKYGSVRQFCKTWLERRDGSTNNEEIRKLNNRFSQILRGKKGIQVDDLPYIADLLKISYEEILSAGKVFAPVSNRVTNYAIAFSHDRDEWERYMKREDEIFLNCDEYCKTVIDYALDFKNYDFIKYLMEEKFIWFVDLSEWEHFGFSYGAGTKIKRQESGNIEYSVPSKIRDQDQLRTRTIALAIENEDVDVLDSLLAREIPELHLVNITGNWTVNFQSHRNDELIRTIALSNKKIIDYYSQEFPVVNKQKRENVFLYPYLDAVIETMLENGRNDSAELLIRRAIEHNRNTLSKLQGLLNDSYAYLENSFSFMPMDKDASIRRQALDGFQFEPNSSLVSYYFYPEKCKNGGLVTNIIHVETDLGDPLIQELLHELTSTYEEIVSLKGKE